MVSHNPPKNDAWKPYADVVFVLVLSDVNHNLKPGRGLVLDWFKDPQTRRWSALVMWLDTHSLSKVRKLEWLPRERLIPVPVDPNVAVSASRRRR